MKLKATAAIIACKSVRLLARVLHKGGTAKPGEIALKICPDILSIVSRGVDTVVVTGTNGKTTSCRILEQTFTEAGLTCAANRSGANLMSGIVTEFIMSCDLAGRCREKYAVMECDEGWVRKVLPQLRPRVLMVTNLFQDQVDRYGDVSNALAAIRAGIESSPETVLCLNADDAVSASLGVNVPNKVVYYGLEKSAGQVSRKPGAAELTKCIFCGAELEYDYVSYAHLGGFRCPECGYSRRDTDVSVSSIEVAGTDSSTVTMRLYGGEEKRVCVNLPANYNVYNASGAIASAVEIGIPAESALAAVENFQCGFGRMEKFAIGQRGARMILVKNTAGCDQVITFLASQNEAFDLVMITNNNPADGTDISWVNDADYEKLPEMGDRLGSVILSGKCAEFMLERMKKAGIAEDKLSVITDYNALTERIAAADKPVFIMPSYTGMMQYRPYLVKRCGGTDFWE